jgi:hypothetical protein
MTRREEEILIRAALSARLPWFSPDAEPDICYTIDPQETIDRCCNCQRAKCINCIDNVTHDHAGHPRKVDIIVFASLLREGLPMKQVCKLLGIGKQTFYNYRNELIGKGATA